MFLETEWYIFIGNSALELIICSFAVSCFQFCNFRLLFSKTKSFEKFSKCSELCSFMYILCIYWLLIARLGVLKLSLCICFVFGFCQGLIWPFFAFDNLATLVWTIVPKMEQKFSPQRIYLQVTQKLGNTSLHSLVFQLSIIVTFTINIFFAESDVKIFWDF